jgi:anti-sigma factor RsiW
MIMTKSIENWALHAYADGELDAAERAEVESLISANLDARRVVDGIRRQKAALKVAYDSVLSEPVPDSVLCSVKSSGQRQTASGWKTVAIAASVGAVVIGTTIGWISNTMWRGPDSAVAFAEAFQDRAINAHIVFASDFSRPVEMGAADKMRFNTWLEKRTGAKFSVPDLTANGYALLGGRLLGEDGEPAGLLMYEDIKTKQRLSIYFAKGDGKSNTPMLFHYRGSMMACYWAEPDLVYALAGEQPAKVMVPLAEAAHDGFDLAKARAG